MSSSSDARAELPPVERFLDVPLAPESMDLYVVRHAVQAAVHAALPQLSGVLLDVGCGEMPYRDLILQQSRVTRYIGLDLAEGTYADRMRPDVTWDGTSIPLDDHSVDSVLATEVLEHCPDPLAVLREIRRVLVPGGVIVLTVPFLWPLHDAPHDEYRYTPWSLGRLLTEAGFTDSDIAPLGGWHAAFAQMIGLWVRRAPMEPEKRHAMEAALFPLYQQLVRLPEPSIKLKDGQMITGLRAVARAGTAVAAAPQPSRGAGLAIVWRNAGALTETFIRRQVETLAPGRTIVIAQQVLDPARIGAPVIVVPESGRSGYSPAGRAAILAAMAEYDVGTILLEYGMENRAFVELHARELVHVPMVVHFHGYDASRALRESSVRSLYARLGAAGTPAVAVSSPMAARLVEAGFQRDRVHVVPYAVNGDAVPQARPDQGPCHFVAVGRLVAKKAPLAILESFRRVCASRPDVRLTIAGDGPLMPDVRAFVAEHELGHAVELLGACEHAAALSLMSRGSVFVQHSVVDHTTGDAEGLPNSILEASAAGLPIVATRHEGIPESVLDGETGWLVDEHDIGAMADRMAQLADDPVMRRQMGEAARAFVRSQFTPERQLHRLRAILGGAGSATVRAVTPVAKPTPEQPAPAGPLAQLLRRLGCAAPSAKPVVLLGEGVNASVWAEHGATVLRVSSHAHDAASALSTMVPEGSQLVVCVQLAGTGDLSTLLRATEHRLAPAGELMLVDAVAPGDPVCAPVPRGIVHGVELIAEGRWEGSPEGLAAAVSNGIAHDDGLAGPLGFVRAVRFRRTTDQGVPSDDRPIVSVLMPTHNRADLIGTAISSVLGQDERRFELVIVDDGSSDDTATVVTRFADPRIRYIQQAQAGAPTARNRAISEARAPWCVWLDSDDALAPGALHTLLTTVAKDPTVDIVYGDLQMADASLVPTRMLRFHDWAGRTGTLQRELALANRLPNPGTLFRRALVDAVGMYNLEFRRAHDYEWWTRVATIARFRHCGATTCVYRWHTETLTGGGKRADQSAECRVIDGMLQRHPHRLAMTPERRAELAVPIADAGGLLLVAKSMANFGGFARAAELIEQANVVLRLDSLANTASELRRTKAA